MERTPLSEHALKKTGLRHSAATANITHLFIFFLQISAKNSHTQIYYSIKNPKYKGHDLILTVILTQTISFGKIRLKYNVFIKILPTNS